MSIKSWEEEFVKMKGTKKTALERTVLKWTGMQKENLKKHGLDSIGYTIFDIRSGVSEIVGYGPHCPLCSYYYEGVSCGRCPLAIAGDCCNNKVSTWKSFDPERMLKVLKKLLVAEKRKQKRKARNGTTK